MIGRTLKRELPNYGTFDEKRIFAAGPLPEPIEFQRGEDRRADLRGHLAREPVCAHLAEAGAELLLVPNGSPYELDKDDLAPALVRSRAVIRPACRSPISTASAGRTRLVFDGSSFVITRTASWSCSCPTGRKRC